MSGTKRRRAVKAASEGEAAAVKPTGFARYLPELLVALAALFSRLAFLLASRGRDPFFGELVMDERVHWDWASEILQKGTLDEAFFRPPLYYYLLAGLRVLTNDSFFLCRLVSSLVGVATAIVVYRLARRIAPAWLAASAALAQALAIESVYFDTRLLTDSLSSLLMLAALAVAVAPTSRPLRFGVVVGLAQLARQVAVVLFPVWILIEVMRVRGESRALRQEWHGLARRFALAFGAFALTLAPVTAINWAKSRDFVPVAWNGGVNFHIGNNAESDGMTAVEWSFRKDWWGSYYDFINAAEEAEGRDLRPSEVSRYWYRRGLAFWRDEPAAALRLLARKARLFVSGAEISNNIPITPEIATAGPAFAHWPIRIRWLLPFLLPGIVLLVPWLRGAREARDDVAGASALVALLYAGLIVMVFVTSRYRLPVYPPLAIVAAATVATMLTRETPRAVRGALGLAVALGLAGLFSFDLPANWPAYHVAAGNLHLQKGRHDQSEAEFRRARALVPEFPQISEGLGMLAEFRKRPDEALEHYRRELTASGSPYSRYRASAILYDQKRYEEALALSQPLIDSFEDASLLHAKLLLALERRSEAIALLERSLARGWAASDSEYLLALARVLEGDERALATIESHRGEERYERLRGLWARGRVRDPPLPVDVEP